MAPAPVTIRDVRHRRGASRRVERRQPEPDVDRHRPLGVRGIRLGLARPSPAHAVPRDTARCLGWHRAHPAAVRDDGAGSACGEGGARSGARVVAAGRRGDAAGAAWRDDRSARRGADRRPAGGGGRLPRAWHQRSRAVPAGRRSDRRGRCRAGRSPCSRRCCAYCAGCRAWPGSTSARCRFAARWRRIQWCWPCSSASASARSA